MRIAGSDIPFELRASLSDRMALIEKNLGRSPMLEPFVKDEAQDSFCGLANYTAIEVTGDTDLIKLESIKRDGKSIEEVYGRKIILK